MLLLLELKCLVEYMDYVVAIPSYKRSDQLPTKTLATLREGNIPMEKIHIFIVQEELELYRASCPGYTLVVGKVGVIEQRNFIQEHFPLDTYIVCLDDDLEQIYRPTSAKTKEVITDLHPVLVSMIEKMNQEQVSICGAYPVDNIMFSFNSKETTTNLSYIIGAFYIIRNTRDPEIMVDPSMCASHEDKYRVILYYLKEKKALRFNRICFKTKYFGKGGQSRPDRVEQHNKGTVALCEQYPSLVRVKKVKKGGLVDIAFKRV
jgi:hypothetical protein